MEQDLKQINDSLYKLEEERNTLSSEMAILFKKRAEVAAKFKVGDRIKLLSPLYNIFNDILFYKGAVILIDGIEAFYFSAGCSPLNYTKYIVRRVSLKRERFSVREEP